MLIFKIRNFFLFQKVVCIIIFWTTLFFGMLRIEFTDLKALKYFNCQQCIQKINKDQTKQIKKFSHDWNGIQKTFVLKTKNEDTSGNFI